MSDPVQSAEDPRVIAIATTVAKHYGIELEGLTGPSQARAFAMPRHIAYYLVDELVPAVTRQAIAKMLGACDRSSVTYGIIRAREKYAGSGRLTQAPAIATLRARCKEILEAIDRKAQELARS